MVRNTENGRCDSVLLSVFCLKTFKGWEGVSDSEHTAPSQAAVWQALPWETWTLSDFDAYNNQILESFLRGALQ